MVKMISLDTSTRSTGYAIWNEGELEKTGFISRGKEEDFSIMLVRLWDFLDKEKPDIVITELTVVVRNADVQRKLTEMLAICHLWCLKNSAFYKELRPTSWRKIIGDVISEKPPKKRESLKEWSVNLVKIIFEKEVNDDIADAILLGQAYCFMAS